MKKVLLTLVGLAIPALVVSCGVFVTKDSSSSADSGKRWILVYNSASGNVKAMPDGTSYQIVMNDVDSGSMFTIRPNREVETATPNDLLVKWSASEVDTFSKNPPNAVLGIVMPGDTKHRMHYFKLSNATYNQSTKTLTLQVQPLLGVSGGQSSLGSTGAFNQAVLVVDGIVHGGG